MVAVQLPDISTVQHQTLPSHGTILPDSNILFNSSVLDEKNYKEIADRLYEGIDKELDRLSSRMTLKFKPEDIIERVRYVDEHYHKERLDQRVDLERETSRFWEQAKKQRYSNEIIESARSLFSWMTYQEKVIAFSRDGMNNGQIFYTVLFLESDLPPSFHNIINETFAWEQMAQQSYLTMIDSLRRCILKVPEQRKTPRNVYGGARIQPMELDTCINVLLDKRKKLFEIAENLSSSRNLIGFYVDICNSERIEDLRLMKKVKTEKIEMTILEDLFKISKEQVTHIKEFLRINFINVLKETTFLNDIGTDMMGRLISTEFVDEK